jgi:DNA-binding beta-propeller fold protein YncE
MSSVPRMLLLALLTTIVLLTGCAEVKYTMHLDPEQVEGRPARVWPDPPQKPRYRYAGQLFGEDNFVSEGTDSRSAGIQILHWLVGLVGMAPQKIELIRPQSGMVDEQGLIYVTDVGRHAVFVFDQAAGKLSVWERAHEARDFVTPVGIVQGPRGEILVADAELGAVIRLDRDGNPLGYIGADALKRPTGLAYDAKRGRLYVSDTHAHDVKVFDDDGHLLEVIGRRGDSEAELNFPTHLWFAADKLYVSDSMNARVLVLDPQGQQVLTLGRRGRFIGDFSRPKGVTADPSGNIYVVESFHDNLLVFNSEGNFLMPIGGTGKEIGQFYLPSGAWSDQHGRIYVADMFNGRVVIFQFLGGD